MIKCEICGSEGKNKRSLGQHIRNNHNISPKEYYDKFLKKEGEGVCKHCKINETGFERGKYSDYCGRKCSKNSIESRSKYKQSCIEKYGCEYAFQNKEVQSKFKSTCLKKYGCEHPMQNKEVKEKTKQTCVERYGCEYVTQNKKVFSKTNQAQSTTKPYSLPSGEIIYKQGYEPQFLDHCFSNNLLTENQIDYSPNPITYYTPDSVLHEYFPDFYIPEYNLIVEIKGGYWYELCKESVDIKGQTCKLLGYDYIMIVNNDFSKFEEKIKSLKAN